MSSPSEPRSFTLVESFFHGRGEMKPTIAINAVSMQLTSASLANQPSGRPFFEREPTAEECYDMAARTAYTSHWASPDQIPHVLVLKQEFQFSKSLNSEKMTYTLKAQALVKQLVRVSGCSMYPGSMSALSLFLSRDGTTFVVLE